MIRKEKGGPEMIENHPRDMIGYGANPPDPKWPNGARLALSFVLNYEAGGEYNILLGDAHSESYLSEIVGLPELEGKRNYFTEDIFEYGSRAGAWRILRLFNERNLTLTVYAVGLALELNPEIGRAFADGGHETASHAYRWINYADMSEEDERKDIKKAVAAIEKTTGNRPVGNYTGRYSPNTRRLIVEEGGFIYDSDAYNDDLPYWVVVEGKPHLVIPYDLCNNDFKFSLSPGWMSADDFFQYLKNSFDVLYDEGETAPKMMSVGLHGRLGGRPGRAGAIARFLDYVQNYDDVWICRRMDIAHHWNENYPYKA
jgi:putative urate catabolism protein